MYPDFEHLLESLLGVDVPGWLSLFKTFGFMVAMAFLAAAYVLVQDLKRKEALGWMRPTTRTEVIGKQPSLQELALTVLGGFFVGFKVGGFFRSWEQISPNPMGYVFSADGNWLGGLAGAAWFGYSRWRELKQQALPTPEERTITILPHQRIGEITALAAIAGLAGAKIFNALETWEDFVRNPAENLLSSSGLTFYGGLILASIVIALYAHRHQISIPHLIDSFAPALMLAYGIGRLGCQFSGDGDWGIFNSAYVTQPSGHLIAAPDGQFIASLHQHTNYLMDLMRQFGSAAAIPHAYVPAPAGLPHWLFAMNYPHNVNNEGVLLSGCSGNYCAVLPIAVFPTPMYEAVVCISLFFVLWGLRKRLQTPLQLAGIYLIMNGVERFLVERIRVNTRYDWGSLHPSQAEIIAVVMVLIGIGLLAFVRKKSKLTAV